MESIIEVNEFEDDSEDFEEWFPGSSNDEDGYVILSPTSSANSMDQDSFIVIKPPSYADIVKRYTTTKCRSRNSGFGTYCTQRLVTHEATKLEPGFGCLARMNPVSRKSSGWIKGIHGKRKKRLHNLSKKTCAGSARRHNEKVHGNSNRKSCHCCGGRSNKSLNKQKGKHKGGDKSSLRRCKTGSKHYILRSAMEELTINAPS